MESTQEEISQNLSNSLIFLLQAKFTGDFLGNPAYLMNKDKNVGFFCDCAGDSCSITPFEGGKYFTPTITWWKFRLTWDQYKLIHALLLEIL
jgi:hypothetical protein